MKEIIKHRSSLSPEENPFRLAYAMEPEELQKLIALQDDEEKFHVFFCEMCEKYKDAIQFE